jgi:phthiodiolone/phenolphthiodiolone dimycocerosates ketoreductase
MLRLTGEYADGWLPVFPMTPDEYGRARSVVEMHASTAGRPMPEAGLVVFVVLRESRQRIQEMFEAQPLGKLLALRIKPESFREHGLEHPLGSHVRGAIDVIQHELDPAKLSALAPTIPFEVLEELVFMGNVDEVAERLRGYAEEGCEHVILLNNTGIVGGVLEATSRASDLLALRESLRAFQSPGAVGAAG